MISKTLYCQDARGELRLWSINATDDGTLTFAWGLIDGAKQYKTEHVYLNQSGRTIKDQTLLQFNARVNRRRDIGYVDSIEEAKLPRTNVLGLPQCMRAKRIEDVNEFSYDSAFIQRKYDGNRCLIANRGGEIIAYSRNGKVVSSIGHITEEIRIPEGAILDGELYCHGATLQTIVSWIKRKQDDTKKLRYHAYDMVDSAPFYKRLASLQDDVIFGAHACLVPTYRVETKEDSIDYFTKFRSEGYEGAILRLKDKGYESNKKSKFVLKMKSWFDDEFPVVGITPSKDGWAILTLMMPGTGKLFQCSAPGSMTEKQYIMDNPEEFDGRWITVEYAYLTKDGIPFHPIAKGWRAK